MIIIRNSRSYQSNLDTKAATSGSCWCFFVVTNLNNKCKKPDCCIWMLELCCQFWTNIRCKQTIKQLIKGDGNSYFPLMGISLWAVRTFSTVGDDAKPDVNSVTFYDGRITEFLWECVFVLTQTTKKFFHLIESREKTVYFLREQEKQTGMKTVVEIRTVEWEEEENKSSCFTLNLESIR